jgi:hypothetical protein
MIDIAVASSVATSSASYVSSASSSDIIALVTADATTIVIMIMSFTTFSFSIVLLTWYLSSHLFNDLIMMI